MKKILVFIAGLTIFSCNTDSKTEVDYALFSGKIENKKGDKIVVKSENFTKAININEDGTFADTLRIDAGYYSLMHGRSLATIYLAPQKDVIVNTDATKFVDSLRFEGTGATPNDFLLAKSKKSKGRDAKAIFSMNEDAFLKTITGFKEETLQQLQETKNLHSEFVDLEKKNINFAYLLNLSRYPMYHAYFAKDDSYEPSKNLLAPIEAIDFDNPENFKYFEPYRELAIRHYSEKINPVEDVKGTVATIKSLKTEGLKNAMAEELSYFISPSNKEVEFLYNSLLEISSKEELKKELTEKYHKIQNLVAGKDSPKFDYENHKGGTTSLDDLKGKYVYIDVWATWCGPCIAEIPSLKKVEKQYHNKDIAFVSISIDTKRDYEKWKKMVVSRELGGVQLIADKDWQSKFVTDYVIDGIPRFILLDPNGKIVNADAPRPSSPKLIELFNDLKI